MITEGNFYPFIDKVRKYLLAQEKSSKNLLKAIYNAFLRFYKEDVCQQQYYIEEKTKKPDFELNQETLNNLFYPFLKRIIAKHYNEKQITELFDLLYKPRFKLLYACLTYMRQDIPSSNPEACLKQFINTNRLSTNAVYSALNFIYQGLNLIITAVIDAYGELKLARLNPEDANKLKELNDFYNLADKFDEARGGYCSTSKRKDIAPLRHQLAFRSFGPELRRRTSDAFLATETESLVKDITLSTSTSSSGEFLAPPVDDNKMYNSLESGQHRDLKIDIMEVIKRILTVNSCFIKSPLAQGISNKFLYLKVDEEVSF